MGKKTNSACSYTIKGEVYFASICWRLTEMEFELGCSLRGPKHTGCCLVMHNCRATCFYGGSQHLATLLSCDSVVVHEWWPWSPNYHSYLKGEKRFCFVFYSEDSGELPGLTVFLLSGLDRIEAPNAVCQAIAYTAASP